MVSELMYTIKTLGFFRLDFRVVGNLEQAGYWVCEVYS